MNVGEKRCAVCGRVGTRAFVPRVKGGPSWMGPWECEWVGPCRRRVAELVFDPIRVLRQLRSIMTTHQEAVVHGEMSLAGDKAQEAAILAESLLAWLKAGGEMRSEWDRWG